MLLELLDLSLAAYCIVPDKMEKVEREAYEMDAQFEIDNRWNHRDSVPSGGRSSAYSRGIRSDPSGIDELDHKRSRRNRQRQGYY